MIENFAYVGFRSPRAAEWRDFGTSVLGAQLVEGTGDEVALRIDDRAARIVVSPGVRDELAYIGWDCGDTLADTIAAIRATGVEVVEEPGLAATRNVDALASFTDPFGFRHELTSGLHAAGRFVPARPISGFLTGEQGLGHIVLIVPDLERATEFFCETLGFRHSDDVEVGFTIRFLHCNPRHHTLALTAIPGMVGVHHIMLEVLDLDDVGRALDIVGERGMTLAMSLGRHSNDLMTSFYVRTPSGFEIEYGTGGLHVDDNEWTVGLHDAISLWGHKPPAEPLLPGVLRPFEPAGA